MSYRFAKSFLMLTCLTELSATKTLENENRKKIKRGPRKQWDLDFVGRLFILLPCPATSDGGYNGDYAVFN